MMGDRPVKLNDEALRVIKVRVDRYATRQNSVSLKPGEESLRSNYARAPEYIPVIARAFAARKIPIVIGVYLPMVESAYTPCYENENGSKGLFQFMPQTAALYGVSRAEMCDVQKMAPAAAHFIADRMAELGDDSQSMTPSCSATIAARAQFVSRCDACEKQTRIMSAISGHFLPTATSWTKAFREKAPGTCPSFSPPQLSEKILTPLICRCRHCRVSLHQRMRLV
jgi:hypothetical protein